MEAVCKQEEREEEENWCINRKMKTEEKEEKEKNRGRTRKREKNKKWNIYRRSVTHHDAEVMRCAILFELVRRIVLVGRK